MMLVPLPDPFVSDAGRIQNIFEAVPGGPPARGVAVIYSKAGSRRSSHRHQEDWHYLYVVSGAMRYTERRLGSETVVKLTVRPGEAVFTGPGVDHWAEFDEDTVLVSVSRLARVKSEHEQDVVRVPWIEEEP